MCLFTKEIENTLFRRTVKEAAAESKKGIQNFCEEEEIHRDNQARRALLRW